MLAPVLFFHPDTLLSILLRISEEYQWAKELFDAFDFMTS